MTEFTKYAPGTFSWVDLATTDAGGAKKFYTELFGWGTVEIPAGPDMTYTMLLVDGKNVAGLSQMGQEQMDQGMPPFWNSYVTVANADKAAAKAKSMGATVLMGAMDVFDSGRMALIQGPTGEALAVWEPKSHIGAQLCNVPVSLCWNELATRDTKTAESFYTQLFGWKAETSDMSGTMYTSFSVGDRVNAGMLAMDDTWPAEIPPHWMVYFAVANCDDTAAKAQKLGGKLSVPPTEIPDMGRFSVIQDPQGAVFSVMQMYGEPPA